MIFIYLLVALFLYLTYHVAKAAMNSTDSYVSVVIIMISAIFLSWLLLRTVLSY